jgi:hypothetical protein
MEKFWHLFWANLMSCKFSIFLFLIPLYAFQIYSVFINKVLQGCIIINLKTAEVLCSMHWWVVIWFLNNWQFPFFQHFRIKKGITEQLAGWLWVFQKHQRTTNIFHQRTSKELVARELGLKKVWEPKFYTENQVLIFFHPLWVSGCIPGLITRRYM